MRLIDAVRALRDTPSGSPSGAGAFFSQGVVVAAQGPASVTVTIGGVTVSAKPVTDEPLTAGMLVWVSQSTEGWLVHGGVH